MKKYKELLFFLMAVVSHFLGALLIGLALMPGYFLVTWVVRQGIGLLPSFLVGLLVCLAIGIGYFLFIDTLLVLIVIARQILGLKNQETELKHHQC